MPVDAGRLPPFFGLGLRLEKRWTMGDAGHVALVFEMLNATLARDYVAPGRRTGPITIPSVALEAAICVRRRGMGGSGRPCYPP